MSESMAESRRAWTDPTLVVLVRNRPEEAVLAGCKTLANTGSGGPSVLEWDCGDDSCGDCNSQVAS